MDSAPILGGSKIHCKKEVEAAYLVCICNLRVVAACEEGHMMDTQLEQDNQVHLVYLRRIKHLILNILKTLHSTIKQP